jgi:hypothetical protein
VRDRERGRFDRAGRDVQQRRAAADDVGDHVAGVDAVGLAADRSGRQAVVAVDPNSGVRENDLPVERHVGEQRCVAANVDLPEPREVIQVRAPADRAGRDREPLAVGAGELHHPAFPHGAVAGRVDADGVEEDLVGVVEIDPAQQAAGEVLEAARDRCREREIVRDVGRPRLVGAPARDCAVRVGDGQGQSVGVAHGAGTTR